MYFTAEYKEYLEYAEQIKELQDGSLNKVDDAILDIGFTLGSVLQKAFDYDFFVDWCERSDEAKHMKEELVKLGDEIENSGKADSLTMARLEAIYQLLIILE